MTTRRKSKEPRSDERDNMISTPSQQDDADIVEEAGAEIDETTGELVVDEDMVRKLGAVDATSVRENRRLDSVIEKKRAGKKDIPFNTKDPIIIYGTLLRYWTPDSIDINVKRLLGGATDMLHQPINGAALYEAILHFHGQHAETEYEVKFTSAGKYQGVGRITMPDTRPAQQQGQPMQYPQPAPGYPPQYATPYVVPQQPNTAPQQPVAPLPFDPMVMMQQTFDLFRQMQSSMQAPQVPPSPPQFVMPPPPAQTDPAAMTAWTQQMFQLFQQMQAQMQQRPAVVQAAPPSPPPPAVDPMAMLTQTFELFQQMQEALRPPPSPEPPPYRGGGPFRGPRPGYYPQGDPRDGPPPGYGGHAPPPPPPPPPKTVAEQFRESMSIVRTAVDAMTEMSSLLPGQNAQADMSPEEDDSPIKIIDTGSGKFAVNKDDGALRWGETGMMLVPGLLKWFGEQHEVIQKAKERIRLREQPQQQQLPDGFVEVHPGYRPPPGYVAVPIDPQQAPLPPQPEHMPPPIREEAPKRAWGMPTIPGEEES